MEDTSTFAEEIFGLHVQQGAEKALKAWIAALGTEGAAETRTLSAPVVLRLPPAPGLWRLPALP